MKKYRNLFQNRLFMRFFAGEMCNWFSDVLFRISVAWTLVYETGSVRPIAILLFVSYLPQLFMGFVGGRWIDRFDRKRIMVFTNLVSGFSVLLLAFFIQATALPVLLYLTRFILSAMDACSSPASMAYLPRLVAKEDLLQANTMYSAMGQGIVVIGAGAAAWLVAALGMHGLLFINSGFYLIGALLIGGVPVDGTPERPPAGEKAARGELRAAVRYILKSPFILQLMILTLLSNIVFDLVFPLIPAYAGFVLEEGVEVYGALRIAASLGMICGVLAVGLLHVRRVGRFFILGSFFGGIVLMLLGLNSSILIALGLFFLLAAFDALSIPCFTYLQLSVSDHIKGRVFAVFDTAVLFSEPVAAAILFFAVDDIGVAPSYLASGGFFVLIAALALCMKVFRRANLNDV